MTPSSSDLDELRLTEMVRGPAPLHTVAMKHRIAGRLFGVHVEPPRLGRFVVTGVLGSGGTGIVYAAFDPQLDRRVALKVLDPTRVAVAPERSRLLREAQALAQLTHPHVVTVHQVDEHDGSVFVVMELVEGVALDKWQRQRPRTLAEILSTYAQAGHGLAAAHAVGLVHRDFKPANALVGRDERVRVVDFGLASRPEDHPSAPSPEPSSGSADPSRTTLAGTPAYMAPEQAAMRAADARSDQFSFCVALWEAVEGVRPWTPDQLRALGGVPAPSLPPAPEVTRAPRWLTTSLRRGLCADPGQRFGSLAELLAELHERPRARRRRMVTAAAGAAITGIVGALVLAPAVDAACPASVPDMVGTWDATRASELELAMRGSAPFGASAYVAVAQRLDAYSARWTDVRGSICAATFQRGTRPRESFERGIACLEHDRDVLATVVELLRTGDGETLARADAIVDELPDPSACRDPDPARLPPGEPGVLARAREVIEAADRARVLAAAGQLAAARAAATAATILAAEADDPAARAEAQLAEGAVLLAAGEAKGARHEFLAAAATAQRGAHDEAAARAWLAAADTDARDLEDAERAALSLAMARATFDRIAAGPAIRAEGLDVEASIAGLEQRLEAAASTRAQAVDMLRALVLPDDPRLLTLERRLANDLAVIGSYDRAEGLYRSVLARVVRRLGPAHPDVGSLELDLGLLARDRGRLDEAVVHVERAHEIRRSAFGDGSPRLTRTSTTLALLELERGQPAQAEAHARQAWELERRALPKGHSERGGALSLLASLHLQAGELERSLAEHLELLGELDPVRDAERRAPTENNAGWLLCQLGRCEEAGPHYRALLSAAPPWPVYGDAGLAEVELASGDAAAAVARVARTMPAVERLPMPDHRALRAELRATHARALAAVGDPEGALQAAALALADHRELGTSPAAVEELEALEQRLRARVR